MQEQDCPQSTCGLICVPMQLAEHLSAPQSSVVVSHSVELPPPEAVQLSEHVPVPHWTLVLKQDGAGSPTLVQETAQW